MPEIQTARLTLTPMSDETRSEFARLATDPMVMRFIGDGKPWAPEKIDEVFDRLHIEWHDHHLGWYAIRRQDPAGFAGFIGLNHVGPEAVEIEDKNLVEIGWWIDPDHWGQGIATEGAFAVRNDAFLTKGLDRLIARHQAANTASGRIMEKIGMRFQREATGRHGDRIRIYELSKEEWGAAGGGV